jgi:DNA replication and repair protein RecF
VFVRRLGLTDFRSYSSVQVDFDPGVNLLLGRNGQGKTNLVEAVDYVATLASHRTAVDGPLVRTGAAAATVHVAVVRDGRELTVDVEIQPARSNRVRVNGSPLPRPRELLGLLRTVLFAPADLALVQGEPAGRRRFLDDLLVARAPRFAAVRADYDRVLRQRNMLLRTVSGARRAGDLGTLDAWDDQLAAIGGQLLVARLELLDALRPLVDKAYAAVAPAPFGAVSMDYVGAPALPDTAAAADHLRAALSAARSQELDRGVTLVGPHRDELALGLGGNPVRGYASHGESWSLAVALRLASYDLLRSDGVDPVLILDDVFAELDADRRQRLADRVAGADQLLVTAAVAADVPAELAGARFVVEAGGVRRE